MQTVQETNDKWTSDRQTIENDNQIYKQQNKQIYIPKRKNQTNHPSNKSADEQ